MRSLRPGPDDVEHSPKSCVVENPVGLRTPSATNRRARARQGDGGEEETDDAASTMSHGATVGPHPRRTGWGSFPCLTRAAAGAHEAPGPPERRTQVGPGTYPCERRELEAGVRRGGGSPAEPLPSRRPRRCPEADRSGHRCWPAGRPRNRRALPEPHSAPPSWWTSPAQAHRPTTSHPQR